MPAPNERCTVLIADDYAETAELIAELLETRGYHTALAFDGREALEMATMLEPDFVLLDIGLPITTGDSVCRSIRQTDWGSKVRIIALTGCSHPSEMKEIDAAGFDAVLTKPCSLDEITRALDGPSTA